MIKVTDLIKLKMLKTENIYGVHAAILALNNLDRKIINWYCTKEVFEKVKNKISLRDLPECIISERKKLDFKFKNKYHQGIIVECTKLKQQDLNDVLKDYNSTILILDSLTDSQNVGAIVRSAYLFGIGLVIYNENNSFDINPALIKSAAGAYEKIKMIKVKNINNIISFLKEKDYWIIGLDTSSRCNLSTIRKDIKKVIILGSEGNGIRKLIKSNCDYLVKIPMKNEGEFIDSLNVSNAASIIFYSLINNN